MDTPISYFTKTKKTIYTFFYLNVLASIVISNALPAAVEYDAQIPQVAFAASELQSALKEADRTDLKICLVVGSQASAPEAFTVQYSGPKEIWVTGTDETGTMYGGLEVADRLRLGLPIETGKHTPFVGKRGIKFNIPLDARTPSYDDSGDAAQNNIETVWDFEFWKAFLDDMARYRYNVLSLWSAHPYPSIIKLDDYPEVALDDVYRIGVDLEPDFRKSGKPGPWGPGGVDINDPGMLKLVKKISVDEKIAHWKRVFQYAEDRGIEVYIFHWNVFTFGATGKHGITERQDNPVTVDYLRKSVRQALLTYPQIKGIGVTAGENADNYASGEHSIENFIFNTYGRAIMDVKELQPNRKVRFIFRQHQTGLGPITQAFASFPDEFDTSFKYAIGHMYSMRRPELLEERGYREEVEQYNVKCWLNLRNDDIFVLRWGNPDFTREYIRRMPHHISPGFYMGSDGYVWGREFVSRDPEMAGRLEIDKHWYRFRQWGQLAYDPFLNRDYWEAVLQQRFHGVDARLLYDSWAATSEIIPLINSAGFAPNDAHISPEGCIDFTGGFLTVDDYYFSSTYNPMRGSNILSVQDWGKAVVEGEKLDGITPLQVADNLDAHAATALKALPELRTRAGDNVELNETLNDIESMAYLGRYYADKMRGAAKLAVFREDPSRRQYNAEAVQHLTDAVDKWKRYAAIASAQYKPQLLARTDFLDWNLILKEVEKEVVTVRREGDYPDIDFLNLKNRAHFPEGTNLKVEIAAVDQDGVRELKLYLNGLLLKGHPGKPGIWSDSSDDLLKALKPGVYYLQAFAEDNTGIESRKSIQIYVGEVAANAKADFKDSIYHVILSEGELLMQGDVIEFPQLECFLTLEDDGKLALYEGTPGNSGKSIWGSRGKDEPYPHFATVENGQLVVYRGTPYDKSLKIYTTRQAPGGVPCKLGINMSLQLVVFHQDSDGNNTTIWKSFIR